MLCSCIVLIFDMQLVEKLIIIIPEGDLVIWWLVVMVVWFTFYKI